jgi:hypothetical protein
MNRGSFALNPRTKPARSSSIVSDQIQLELLAPWYAQRPEDTRTLDLFDALPKYPFSITKFVDRAERIDTKFKFRDKYYYSAILPAQIRDPKTGEERLVFPGGREELVERALRYLAVQQIAKVRLTSTDPHSHAVTVFFTLSMIRRHLGQLGHGFNIAEIKEALEILSGTMIEITVLAEDGTLPKRARAMKATILTNYTKDFADEDPNGEASLVGMTFHPLATEAILKMGYFPMNALRVGRLKSKLARTLATRMSHNFRGANRPKFDKENMVWVERKSYNISLKTLLAERAMVQKSRLRDNLSEARDGINELKEAGFLWDEKPCEEKLVYTPTARRPKIDNVIWNLYPSDEFISEIIDGNDEMTVKKAKVAWQPQLTNLLEPQKK